MGFLQSQTKTVAILHHGPGLPYDPESGKDLTFEMSEKTRNGFQSFIKTTFPELENQPWSSERLCWYADSFDGDFIIDYVPESDNTLFVCSGDSGHAFKFGSIWVDILLHSLETGISETKTGIFESAAQRFRWREANKAEYESSRAV
jgi:hypothetical protein